MEINIRNVNTDPVKIIRFDKYGFITKPYNSSVFYHSFAFLNIGVPPAKRGFTTLRVF